MHCARPPVTATTVRQLRRIIVALVAMTGRVTRLGIARWAGPGGSYRTSQRFVATVIPWGLLLWVFFRHSMACPGDVSLVAGDDVSVSKAGTCTHGLDRFLARLSGQPVPGLAFCTLSLVRVQARHAFPRRVEPGVRSDAEQAACKTHAATKPPKAPCATRRPGRPKGRKHTPNAAGPGPPEFGRIAGGLDALLHLIAGVIPWTSVVLDGHCGHHHALQRARPSHLPLLATLRDDAALSCPYAGLYAGRGPHRQ